MPAMLAAIAEHQPALVFLAYPNNPTGNLFDADDMVAHHRARWATPASPWSTRPTSRSPAPASWTACREFANLVVMRTLSKLGLAGIRLGYMSAAPALLEQFDKVRPPYNINVLTQVAAEFALDHLEVLERAGRPLNAARDRAGGRAGGAAGRRGVPVGRQFPAAAGARCR